MNRLHTQQITNLQIEMRRFNIEPYHFMQGFTIILAGGLTAYAGYETYIIYKSRTIDYKVYMCFNMKTRKGFYDDVWDVSFHSTLSSEAARICVQKRWEVDGKWQKALEERC